MWVYAANSIYSPIGLFIDHPTPEASWRAQQGPSLDPGAAACLPFPRQPRKAGLPTLSHPLFPPLETRVCGFPLFPKPGAPPSLRAGEWLCTPAGRKCSAEGRLRRRGLRAALAGTTPPAAGWALPAGTAAGGLASELRPGTAAGPAPEPRLPKFLLTQRGPRPRSQFPRNPRPSTLPALCRVSQELSVPPSSLQAPFAPPRKWPAPVRAGLVETCFPQEAESLTPNTQPGNTRPGPLVGGAGGVGGACGGGLQEAGTAVGGRSG